MKTEALITAGGSSRRMGGGCNKLFLTIEGVPVLIRSAMAFANSEIISSISISAEERLHPIIKSLWHSFGIKKRLRLVKGGDTRQESVRNLLISSDPDTDLVMVHDGARPMIATEEIEEIARASEGFDGAVPCRMMSDTVKTVSGGMITGTLPRETLAAVQTPQAFKRGFLLEAFAKAGLEDFTGTDESSLAERAGGRIKAYETHRENIKITYPDDINKARQLIKI